jgi:hypothetical protein
MAQVEGHEECQFCLFHVFLFLMHHVHHHVHLAPFFRRNCCGYIEIAPKVSQFVACGTTYAFVLLHVAASWCIVDLQQPFAESLPPEIGLLGPTVEIAEVTPAISKSLATYTCDVWEDTVPCCSCI